MFEVGLDDRTAHEIGALQKRQLRVESLAADVVDVDRLRSGDETGRLVANLHHRRGDVFVLNPVAGNCHERRRHDDKSGDEPFVLAKDPQVFTDVELALLGFLCAAVAVPVAIAVSGRTFRQTGKRSRGARLWALSRDQAAVCVVGSHSVMVTV